MKQALLKCLLALAIGTAALLLLPQAAQADTTARMGVLPVATASAGPRLAPRPLEPHATPAPAMQPPAVGDFSDGDFEQADEAQFGELVGGDAGGLIVFLLLVVLLILLIVWVARQADVRLERTTGPVRD